MSDAHKIVRWHEGARETYLRRESEHIKQCGIYDVDSNKKVRVRRALHDINVLLDYIEVLQGRQRD